MLLTDLPSIILKALLIREELASDGNDEELGEWPLYVSHEPDNNKEHSDTVTLYDTGGNPDGRYMTTGEHVEHETLQVIVRSDDYLTGYTQIKAIAKLFETISREPVLVGTITYTIANISRDSPPLAMGTEKGTKRRDHFSLNVTLTINEEE